MSNLPLPKPSVVQWYKISDDGQSLELYRDTINGAFCNNLFGWRTQLEDCQIGLVQPLAGADAFSFVENDNEGEGLIFFIGRSFIPREDFFPNLTNEDRIKLQSNLVYGKYISRNDKTFYLNYFRHCHLQIDENNKLILPSGDRNMFYQQKQIISRLKRLILYGQMTIKDAAEILANCEHELISEETAPWNQSYNVSYDKCGLGFSVSELGYREDEDRTWRLTLENWPQEVYEVSRNFSGLLFNGIDGLCFHRNVMLEDGPGCFGSYGEKVLFGPFAIQGLDY